jgi:CD36 family.
MFGKSVWMTKSVGEFLIDGYSDPLLTMSNLLSPSASQFSSDKIGVLHQRNGSMIFDGVTNINTGEDDLTKMGNINYHNYVNQTENFEAECGRVTGSLGDFFGAIATRERHLNFFIPRLCR